MDNELPKGFRGVNYPAGKGDKDTRTNPRKYREAPLWDNFGPDKRSADSAQVATKVKGGDGKSTVAEPPVC